MVYHSLLLAGIGVFAWQRSRMDVWWLAFFSGALYGLPVAFGYDIFGRPIAPVAIGVVLGLQGLLLGICTIRGRRPTSPVVEVSSGGYLATVATLVCTVSFVLLLWNYGTALFFVHKSEAGVSGYFYVLWRMSATYAMVIAVIERRYVLAAFALVPLLATIFAGDRTAVALTAAALVWMSLHTGRMAGARLGIAIPVVAALGLFLFFGKTFQALWISGDFSSFPTAALQVWSEGAEAVAQTEPFAVMGVFSALTGLTASPPGHLLLEVGAQLLVVPSWFGLDSTAFNDFYQPLLFPEFKERSLAYSFWGEGYVRAGWIGVCGFIAVFCAGLALFDRLSRSQSLALRSFAYVGGAYWAFYIHRNSLVSMLAYQRQIILFLLALVFLATLLKAFTRRLMR